MASTEFASGSSQTVKRWSDMLYREAIQRTFFSKFAGRSKGSIIQVLTDLEKNAGDQIKYDLRLQNRSSGVQGDNPLKGYERALTFAQDTVSINQLRQGHEFKAMSQQRTTHDLREEAKAALVEWWAWQLDGLMFAYLAGTCGAGPETVQETIDDAGGDAVGFAGNALRTASSGHEVSAVGAATSISDIDKMVATAKTVNPTIQPVEIDGGNYYVLIVHPYTAYALRSETGETKWNLIQQRAGERGKDNPIFSGALGIYNQTIIYESEYIPITTATPRNYNLFLGAGAGVFAMGNAYNKRARAKVGGGSFFSWSEEIDDYGNSEGVGSGAIFGIQKSQFSINGTATDLGVIRYLTDDAAP